MTPDTRQLVAEIEEATAAARERAEARATARNTIPLESNLGSITMSGYGDLVSVDLDPEHLRFTTERRLATAVRNAIQRATGGGRG